LLLSVVVHPANVQDSNGAFPVMRAALQKHPSISKFLADGGYQLPRLSAALAEISVSVRPSPCSGIDNFCRIC
jgi:hypothetical protein